MKGKISNHGDGYLVVNVGKNKRQRLHHRVIMEEILNRPLLDTEVVHHDDEDKGNNHPSNLVLCRDETEHRLIHLQKRALKESGYAHYRKCSFCKKWDDPKNLVMPKSGVNEHRECGNEYRNNWQKKKRALLPPKQMSRDEKGRIIWTPII